jgi:hypothetical protein
MIQLEPVKQKLKVLKKYHLSSLIDEPSSVAAFSGGCAVLSLYSRRLLLLSSDKTTVVELESLARIKFTSEGDFRRRGAIFVSDNSIGVVFGDVLHFVDWSTGKIMQTLPITNLLQSENECGHEPLIARKGLGQFIYVAVYYKDATVYDAQRIVKLSWDGKEAKWEGTMDNALGISSKSIPFTGHLPKTNKPAVISDMIVIDKEELLMHTSGPEYNHARYGMDYSAIVGLSATGKTHFIKSMPDGYAQFDTEGKRLIFRPLYKKNKGNCFYLYELDGTPVAAYFKLTPKIMGAIKDFFMKYSLSKNDLWIFDGHSNAAHILIED